MIKMKMFKGEIDNIKTDSGIDMKSIICRNKNVQADFINYNNERIMINKDTGYYFVMNTVGERIWSIIEKDISVNDIINRLLLEYEVSIKECKYTVLSFLEKLYEEKAIIIK